MQKQLWLILIKAVATANIHSLATLLGKPLLVPGWTPFCLQNCLNSLLHRFNNVLETFLRDLVHIDMIVSRSCCRFVGCTSMMQIFRSTTSQRCSIGLRSGDCVEAIWVKWTHCHVQETSLRWFELCDRVHYPAGSSHQKMGTLVIKGYTWSATILGRL